MIAINEYIINSRNLDKVLKDNNLFKKINDSIEYNELKELFEISSYKFIQNTKHKIESENDVKFNFYNKKYIYEQFNLTDKQYLLGFTKINRWIFAMNPVNNDENEFIGFYEHFDSKNTSFKIYNINKPEPMYNLSSKEAIEYLIK